MEKQNRQPDYLMKIDELKEAMTADLQGLVRIDSVQSEPEEGAPFGRGVKEAFDYMLALGDREGFSCRNVDDYGGHIDYGDGNGGVMGILCHLDVVPEGSGWDYDPFGAEIINNVMYGRGTADDKGPAIAAFYAMKALKDCGYVPERKVRMILGLDEETGSTGMEYYLKRVEAPDFGIVPDSDFPLVHGEMGIMVFDLVKKLGKPDKGGYTLRKVSGGTAANMVADTAQAVIMSESGYDDIKNLIERFNKDTGYTVSGRNKGKNFEVSCFGISAHGAMPWKGTNAISIMMSFLSGLNFNCSEVNDFIDFYNSHIGFDLHGERLGCAFEDDISGKLILNVGMAETGMESAKITVNVRAPISVEAEAVYEGMRPVIGKFDIGVVKGLYNAPVYFPVDDPFVQTLLKIYRKHTGDDMSEPLVTGGGTYAREMKNAIAFGAQYPGDPDLMHQKNECVRIERLVQTARIYAETIYELAVK